MRRLLSYVREHPVRSVVRVVYATPFILSFALVYIVASVFGVVPWRSDCPLDHVKTVAMLGIDFEVSSADCPTLIDVDMRTVVRASQRGDWSPTKIFEYGGEVNNLRIEAIDERTIRISIPAKFGQEDRGVDVYEVYAQRSAWRGVDFVYDQAGPDDDSK